MKYTEDSKPKKKPTFTPSEETLKLEAYLLAKKNGEEVTYKELKEELSFDIKAGANRGMFYTACKRLGRECLNKPNYGYILSSVENSITIASNKTERIIGSTRRMVKATTNLETTHSEELPQYTKDVFENNKTVGNAILGKARMAKRFGLKKSVQISEANPIVA